MQAGYLFAFMNEKKFFIKKTPPVSGERFSLMDKVFL